MTLSELEAGKLAIVEQIQLTSHRQELGKRLTAMGIISFIMFLLLFFLEY